MFYSRSLAEALTDFGSMCPITQIGKIMLKDKGDIP